MTNHYFDNTKPLHPYTFSAPAMPGTLPPDNALRADLPFAFEGDSAPVKANVPAAFAGLWPCVAAAVGAVAVGDEGAVTDSDSRDESSSLTDGAGIARGGDWTLEEDHRGEEGFLHGEAHTIKEVGPYPDGWSALPPPAPEPTPEEQQAAFTAAIQERLDVFAQTRGYDGIMSAATYAASGDARFAAEGLYAVEARDRTWRAAYAVLEAASAGERAMPTLEEVFAELPELAWPEAAAELQP